MPYNGFPGVDNNITDVKTISLAGLFNSVLFILDTQNCYISDITETKTGTGTVSASGDVYQDMNVVIEITTGGNIETAEYKYSIDGGTTYSDIKVTETGDVLLDYGLIITFGGTGFVIGDKYEFFTKAGFRKRTIEKINVQNYKTLITHKQSQQYLDVFFKEAGECYVISPPNDVSGSIVDETGSVTGDGTIVASGEPNQTSELKIKITTTGDIGTAEYLYYIDDIQINDAPETITDYIYFKDVNVTLNFTDGTPGSSFVQDDEYVFSLTVSGSSNILYALTTNLATPTPTLLNNVKISSLFSHICIPTPLVTLQLNQLKYLVDQRQSLNNFAGYILQARKRDTLTVENYKTLLLNNIVYFKDYRCCMCLDYVNTNTADIPIINPTCLLLASQVATNPVNVDAGEVSKGALDIVSRYDEDNLQLIELDLNNAGYTVVRLAPDVNGIYGYFFANTQVLSEENSNFLDYIDVRIFFKGLTILTYKLYGKLKKAVIVDDFVFRSIAETIQNETIAEMGTEITNLTFQILTTATEYLAMPVGSRYLECKTEINGLSLISKFVNNSSYIK